MGSWQHGQHCQSSVVSSQEEIQKYTTFVERTLLRTKAMTRSVLSAQVDQPQTKENVLDQASEEETCTM